MEFTFSLATPADDPDIRQLLAQNPVLGETTLTYEREPNYFWGCGTMGHFYEVIVARHLPTGQLAGIGNRAVRPLYVNGQVQMVGYLSQLRVAEAFRGRGLISQGFEYLRTRHADGRTTGYLATIIEGSPQATGALVEHPRPNQPAFAPVTRLWTLALILGRPEPIRPAAEPCTISRATAANLSEIVALFGRYGAEKQFFPAYTESDFGDHPLTRSFSVEDFFLARQNGKLAGVMGLWSQSGYKQSVVQGYSGSLKWGRPFYNAALQALGAQALPAPGQPLKMAYAAFTCIANNDPAVFAALLKRVSNLSIERGHALLMLGLTEPDPLLAVARRRLHIPYRSRLYTVGWTEAEAWRRTLDQRIPYLELAAL